MTKKSKSNKRNGNIIKAYFKDFGLRQTTAILLIISSIVALVGICVPEKITLIVGLALYTLAAVMGIVTAVRVMYVVRNKRAPQYKRSAIATVLLTILLALALTGLILTCVNGIYN